jgi:hypothetical protein
MRFFLFAKMPHSIPERPRDVRSPKHQNKLRALAALSVLMCGKGFAAEFKAGFSSVDISTRQTLPMGGYGTFFLKTPRMNSAGIHDPLSAGAVLLETSAGKLAALVSVDAVGLSGTQISRIEKQLRETIDPQLHLMISATHTHHSPDTLGLWGSLPRSGRNADYARQIETAIVQAVRNAFATRVPVKVTQRLGRHANDSTASAEPQIIQDGFVSLTFRSQQDGRVLGTLTQWAAHPTVLGMENNALSADYVGAFREVMARRLGRVPHLYFNGAIGKVYPLIPAADAVDVVDDLFPSGDRDPDVKDGYRFVSSVGLRFAESVLKAVETPLQDTSDDAFKACHVKVEFPVENRLFKLASNLKVVETPIRNGKISSRVSSLQWGPVQFVSIPGEAFPKVFARVPADVWQGRTPFLMALGQDWLGYFVDEEDYQRADLKYWTDLSVHPQAARLLVETLTNAVEARNCTEWSDEASEWTDAK